MEQSKLLQSNITSVHAWMLRCTVMSDSVTVAHQTPVYGLFQLEYWNDLPFPTPEDLPDPGIKPGSPVSPGQADGFSTTAPPGKLFCSYASD